MWIWFTAGFILVGAFSWYLEAQKRAALERICRDRRALNELCNCSWDSGADQPSDKSDVPFCWSCSLLRDEPVLGHLRIFDTWLYGVRGQIVEAIASAQEGATARVLESIAKGPGDGLGRAAEALSVLKKITDDEVAAWRSGGKAGWDDFQIQRIKTMGERLKIESGFSAPSP